MAELDERFKNLQHLNTPERIQRIEDFSIVIKITVIDAEMHPYIEMSEAIVAEPSKLAVSSRSIARFLFGLDMEDYIDPDFVKNKIEKKIKRMLLYGGFYFEDEVEGFEFVSDNEIASLDGEELLALRKVDN